MHVRHMTEMLQKEYLPGEIYNLIAIADGGPDWSVKGLINLMSLGMFWLNNALDILVVQCYAPGHSRFNPIERAWSFLTKWLVGVTLPADIDGNVPKDDDDEGWSKVLDNAAHMCTKFWNGKSVNGHKIFAKPFYSSSPEIPALKTAHLRLQEFAGASKRKIKEDEELSQLHLIYKFLVTHCCRKPYQIEFIRCIRQNCNHCSNLPERSNPLLHLVKELGGSFPMPTTSDLIRGDHYENLKDILQYLKYKPKLTYFTTHGRCTFGCNYYFFSQADIDRHNRLMGHKVLKPKKKKKKSKNNNLAIN